MNKRTVEALIKCGVFDSFGTRRSALLASFENIIDSEYNKRRNNIAGQLDIFSLSSSCNIGGSESYQYPDIPEYSLRELLILEKESSGTYFSGHMIDNYSLHVQSLGADRISDILEDAQDGAENEVKRFKDKQLVKLTGIISGKKTKVIKNGDTMAFITLEDRFGEIEVIVFAKQYQKHSSELFVENAVCIEGSVSFEDGDEVRILLSSLTPLKSNVDFQAKSIADPQNEPTKIYVKIESMQDHKKLSSLTRLGLLNPGKATVIVYDTSTRKYHAMKDITLSHSEKVISRLKTIFGEECIVLK